MNARVKAAAGKATMPALLITSICCLLAASASAEEAAQTRSLVETGDDFCFTRSYDAAHMKSHPHQLVSSIRIMARNARYIDGNKVGHIATTATVTFRDQKKPLSLYGLCFDNQDRPDRLRCSLVPDDWGDVLVQTIELQPDGQRIRATASSDWLVVRAGKEPDGPYGKPKTDDQVFLLDRWPFEACTPSKELWGADGATPALVGRLP